MGRRPRKVINMNDHTHWDDTSQVPSMIDQRLENLGMSSTSGHFETREGFEWYRSELIRVEHAVKRARSTLFNPLPPGL